MLENITPKEEKIHLLLLLCTIHDGNFKLVCLDQIA